MKNSKVIVLFLLELILMVLGAMSSILSIIIIEESLILLSNRKDIPELLFAMDVFVLPLLFEGLGIVATEAQAAGLPVILSDGVSKEAIVTNNAKVLSLKKTVKEWAKQILFSKAPDANIEEKIQKAGFDVRTQATTIQNLYIDKVKGETYE